MSAPATLRISDHALLRWLERIGGIDVEQLRSHLEAGLAHAHEAAAKAGGGNYLIVIGDWVHVVRGGVVTTIFEEPSPRNRALALANVKDAH